MIADSSSVYRGHLHTEFVRFPSRNGLDVSACLDRSGDQFDRSLPWAVVAPKFGETKKNALQLAYFLAANGMNVIRFDHTNHVGESAGDQTFFTLSSGVLDLLGCGDYLEQTLGVRKFTLVANSLSARTAIRAAAEDARIAHLVCLVGVVNLQHTLTQVYRDDLVGGHLQGRRWGIGDMLGVEMDYDGFLRTAVADQMHDLETTRADLERTAAAITFFSGERDMWVSLAEVDAVLRGRTNARLTPIPDAMHELRENPAVAEQAFRDVVAACVAAARGTSPGAIELLVPDKRELMRQNRAERERLRAAVRDPQDERDFWAQYLEKYRLMQNVDDYQSYISLVGRLLGEIRPGDTLLDAGCGNGLFGMWVLRTLLERARRAELPPVYVGLDLTIEGLRDAFDLQTGYALDHRGPARPNEFISLLYGQTDLDTWGMPASEAPELLVFADGCFDKICCSLVLSYLNRPECLLAELHRVLRPGGKIVVSSMKPFCDLSEIYRDFMDQQLTDNELESGRNLLRAAGKIRLKEEQGFYTFYSGEELSALLTAAGFKHCAPHLSLGGQAALVVAEK
ncbi:MAG: hypothetical protein C0518_09060 [Opitutus sp.]|nr:hypothetical protein [Opitutus sp.]